MKKIYRGYSISQDMNYKTLFIACKGNKRIIGTEKSIREKIEKEEFENWKKILNDRS